MPWHLMGSEKQKPFPAVCSKSAQQPGQGVPSTEPVHVEGHDWNHGVHVVTGSWQVLLFFLGAFVREPELTHSRLPQH